MAPFLRLEGAGQSYLSSVYKNEVPKCRLSTFQKYLDQERNIIKSPPPRVIEAVHGGGQKDRKTESVQKVEALLFFWGGEKKETERTGVYDIESK